MGLFNRIRMWYKLRIARTEEKKHIPGKKEILLDQKKFLQESKRLKQMITKEKVYKSNLKSQK